MNTNKHRQFRNSLIYLVPPIISASLPILTLPIFTRVLNKEDFGAYALAQIYGSFVSGFINSGLTTAYERNFFEYRVDLNNQAKLLYGVLSCVLGAFGAAIILTWFFREQLASLIIGNRMQGSLLFWCTCSLCVLSFKQYFLLYFRNIEDAASYAQYSIDEMILNTIFSIMLIYIFRVGVVGLAIGPLMGSLIIFTFLITKFVRKLKPALSWQPVRNSLSLALPLTPLALYKILGTQADKYLLGLLGNLGGVGLYSIGQRFGYLVFLWMTALQNVFSPQVYDRMFTLPSEEGSSSIGRYLTPFAYLCVGGALMVILFAHETLILLTPPTFHDACGVAGVLSMFYSIMFFSKIPQLTFARKTHLTSVLSLGSNILNFVFCLVGIRLWGMMGAAWGLLFAAVITQPITIFLGQNSYKIQWEKKRLAVIYIYMFIAGGCTLYLQATKIEILPVEFLKAAFLGGYIWIGVRIGFFSRENLIESFRSLCFWNK